MSPRFIGPFKIINKVNEQTVSLELPLELTGIHNTFNVCYLRKCKVDEDRILPLQQLKVDANRRLVEEPVEILDSKVKRLCHKEIKMMLVKWRHNLGPNMTWETEDLMRAKYPQLFLSEEILRTESY